MVILHLTNLGKNVQSNPINITSQPLLNARIITSLRNLSAPLYNVFLEK